MIEFGSNKIGSIKEYYTRALSPLYGKEEADAITFLVFEHILGYKRHQVTIKSDEPLNESTIVEFVHTLKRLKKHEPVQYIFGKTWFRGLELKVNSHVLIPRPETEELVEQIIDECSRFSSPRLLDLCTGSGCIALALKAEIRNSTVYALDVSEDALLVTEENSKNNDLPLTILKEDVLSWQPDRSLTGSFDIVVSNPPYIPHSEAAAMKENVLHYEPELALFVKEEDPLIFYERISALAMELLKHGGYLFFEINERFGKAVAEAMIHKGFSETTIVKDMNGKDRIVKGLKA
jgi:release factor glutamine methyltransferase